MYIFAFLFSELNNIAAIGANNAASMSAASVVCVNKTKLTCQMCKKQFDQRIDLSRHQCIELHLKLLKKKKDMRKKKWREAHWKRKIDLSYIETTSLTQLSQNIADNLSFCVDGTQEDLKSYSREVKDYLNTELGQETQMQMFLKCSFPEFYESLSAAANTAQTALSAAASGGKKSSSKTTGKGQSSQNSSESSIHNLDDAYLIRKANSYFANCFYLPSSIASATNESNSSLNKSVAVLPSLSCKYCRLKVRKIADLIQHQREAHNFELKTAFDCYNTSARTQRRQPQTDSDSESLASPKCTSNWLSSSNIQANSPIGFLGCDPFSFVINMYWDQVLKKKCKCCQKMIARPKYHKHMAECQSQMSPRKQAHISYGGDSEGGADDDYNTGDTSTTDASSKTLAKSNENSNDQEIIIFEPRTEAPHTSPSLSMKVENESDDLNESKTFIHLLGLFFCVRLYNLLGCNF